VNNVEMPLKVLHFAKLLLSQWWFTALAILSVISTASTFAPAFYAHFSVPRWIPLIVFGIAFFVASFRVHLKESAEIEALESKIASLKNPMQKAKKVLSVLTHKPMGLSEVSRRSEIAEKDDAEQTLEALKDAGKVMQFDPDEVLPETFWMLR
jgi:hypothetical protein